MSSTPTLPPIKHKFNAQKARDHLKRNILLYYDTGRTSETYKLATKFNNENSTNSVNDQVNKKRIQVN